LQDAPVCVRHDRLLADGGRLGPLIGQAGAARNRRRDDSGLSITALNRPDMRVVRRKSAKADHAPGAAQRGCSPGHRRRRRRRPRPRPRRRTRASGNVQDGITRLRTIRHPAPCTECRRRQPCSMPRPRSCRCRGSRTRCKSTMDRNGAYTEYGNDDSETGRARPDRLAIR
jgi:hypothetical protein